MAARRPDPKDVSPMGGVRFWAQSTIDWCDLVLSHTDPSLRDRPFTQAELDSLTRMLKQASNSLELAQLGLDRKLDEEGKVA